MLRGLAEAVVALAAAACNSDVHSRNELRDPTAHREMVEIMERLTR
jgi:hypothetical protein